MAIEIDIVELEEMPRNHDGPSAVYDMPPKNVQHVSAAGSSTLTRGARFLVLRNYGDVVHFRLNLSGDSTQASASDSLSIKLRADEEFAFNVFNFNDDETYSLDIRAA